MLKPVGILRRLSVVTACLALLAGNSAVCAGWAPTREARMACCAGRGTCMMHKADSHDARALTQAQADGCCASSERDGSNPAPAASITLVSLAVLGSGTVIASAPGHPIPADAWRTFPALRTTPIPRHLLLSVFLV